MTTSRKQHGLTLIELMLAVTLGFLISAVVLSLYINTGKSLAQNERYAWMQENARFALKAVSEDLAMADFWGRVIPTDVVTSNVTPPVGDCGEDIDLYDPGTAIMVNNYHESPAWTQFTPCAALTTDRRPNTDVLAIKRVEGSSTASTFVDAADIDGDSNTTEVLTLGASDLSNGVVYLRSTVSAGTFIDDASSSNPPGSGQSDWRYMPRVYFIRNYYENAGDQIPALCRQEILDDALSETQCIAEGIEDFHVQFGIDTDEDAIANLYTSTPSLDELENAVSARLYLLARSVEADPHFNNDTEYVLGDADVDAANDGFYRRVYSTTVALRNTASRSLMQ
jgi:type IV pilus assembly protein PilW